MKTYSQVLDYLYSRLPMYQRVGAQAYKADLSNTIKICKVLGNPQETLRCIHIAGTNGKGSTSNMLAAVLAAAGYKVGLYTSPHLKDFRERVRVNGKMIPKQYVVDFVNQHRLAFEAIEPSFFEWTVGLAFQYFETEKVDVAIIETGLGGRLDSTNVIHPELSIITNIAFDHVELLGNTLAQIAHEKAGIIKKKVPVIITEFQQEIEELFRLKAKELEAPIYFADLIYTTTEVARKENALVMDVRSNGELVYRNLLLDLPGLYQLKNIKGVVKAVDLLNTLGFTISAQEMRSGLKRVKKLTGLQGRWQVVQQKPLVICDTGHNEAGIAEILKQLASTPHKKLHWVLGVVNDKDITKILAMLPCTAQYYFCKPNIPRGLPAADLKMKAEEASLKGELYKSVEEALTVAKRKAKKDDLILVAGSNFVVAEIL